MLHFTGYSYIVIVFPKKWWPIFLFNLLLFIPTTPLWDPREYLLKKEGPGTIKRFIRGKKKTLKVLNGPIFNFKKSTHSKDKHDNLPLFIIQSVLHLWK